MLTGNGDPIEPSDLPDTIRGTEPPCERKPGLSLAESSERDLISRTLRSCNGNVTATAAALGLAKSTVYAKLHRYDIRCDPGSAKFSS
jgi:transcriptional regulator of acetoin/glycerol metabolism